MRFDVSGCDGSTGVGSGFLIAPNLVATVAHVVNDTTSVTLQAGSETSVGQVVGLDAVADVALVRAMTPFHGHVFSLASSAPAVGTSVAAIGFPEGLPITLTSGTVSGLGRTIQIEGIDRQGLVQIDAPVNPGNSGGPLLTSDGKVVGLVDALRTDANGIAYAVSPVIARPLLTGWRRTPSSVSLASCGSPLATGPPGTGSEDAILGLANQVLTAEVAHDWTTVRAVYGPDANFSDAQLDQGDADLVDQTAYPASAPTLLAPNVWELRFTLVAHNLDAGQQVTETYCQDWRVDLSQPYITLVTPSRQLTTSPVAGWIDPPDAPTCP